MSYFAAGMATGLIVAMVAVVIVGVVLILAGEPQHQVPGKDLPPAPPRQTPEP